MNQTTVKTNLKHQPASWREYAKALYSRLDKVSVRDREGKEIEPESGFIRFRDISLETGRLRGKVFFIGNGASASMASHFSTDLTKNGRIQSEVLTDPALITAYANDTSYDQVFAEPLKLKMNRGDMLVAISSSGKSPNILLGAETARHRGGSVVTLSAMDADNPLRALGDLNFYIPAETYGIAESGHAAILHFWMDLITGGIKNHE